MDGVDGFGCGECGGDGDDVDGDAVDIYDGCGGFGCFVECDVL